MGSRGSKPPSFTWKELSAYAEAENPNKLNYIYVLTPKGISEKAKLTINFMKRKMKEYDELKKEIGK